MPLALHKHTAGKNAFIHISCYTSRGRNVIACMDAAYIYTCIYIYICIFFDFYVYIVSLICGYLKTSLHLKTHPPVWAPVG